MRADANGAPEETASSDAGLVLAIHNLEVVYSDVVLVLRGVSIDVPDGSIVAVLGSNGAGKTTLLRAITGLLPVHRGKITKGTIELEGREIQREDAPSIVRSGVAQVMEGRRVFAELTVDENLRAGGFVRRDRASLRESYQRVLDMFPVLADRRDPWLATSRAASSRCSPSGRRSWRNPSCCCSTSPPSGWRPPSSPTSARSSWTSTAQGTGVLLVEQNANMALSIADHGYVLETGRVVKEGTAAELLADTDIREFYLGDR